MDKVLHVVLGGLGWCQLFELDGTCFYGVFGLDSVKLFYISCAVFDMCSVVVVGFQDLYIFSQGLGKFRLSRRFCLLQIVFICCKRC